MPADLRSDATTQKEVLEFLGAAATHGLTAPPLRIDTHCSVVFLAGDEVYKVKRAIKLPFLDYSTLERRKWFCEREYAVNHALAPTLYKGVVAITRTAQGFQIGGAGETVEWAVHLRRFDESRSLDRIAAAGALDEQTVRDLATVVCEAHSAAKVVRNGGATLALEKVVHETLNELAQATAVFPREEVGSFSRAMRASFGDVRSLLTLREATGHVRRCHGDMHLRNIVLLDGKVTLFDAIEFDETLATTDTLYDLAFLLMDLWEKRLRDEANAVLNRYLWRVGDLIDELSGLAALPLFLSLRAAIRAKVAALNAARSQSDTRAAMDARLYFATAQEFLKPCRPMLVAIGGRSGTGKSTLARMLAPRIGRAPGAIHLRSDIERKRQFHVGETTRLPVSAYQPDVSYDIYEALDRQASAALQTGQSVILDATFLKAFEAKAASEVARRAGVDFHGIWLDAPTGLLASRLFARRNDASDATPDLLPLQPVGETPAGWTCLDAGGAPGELRGAAVACLGLRTDSRDLPAG